MPSFDVMSEVDLQEMDNAVNQAIKEITTRYDFRGSKSSINFDKEKKILHLIADDDFKMKAVIDIVQSKVIKRGISLKSLQEGKFENAAGGLRKCDITLVMGIEIEKAREIVKLIKDAKMKVQAQIMDDQVRVSGKNKDDLQSVMALLRGADLKFAVQFTNYR